MTEKRYWRHEAGDEYSVILARAVTGPGGHVMQHTRAGPRTKYLGEAKRIGFQQGASDDFNIGVWRDGKLTAILWMREIVDDATDLMAKIAAEIGEPHA